MAFHVALSASKYKLLAYTQHAAVEVGQAEQLVLEGSSSDLRVLGLSGLSLSELRAARTFICFENFSGGGSFFSSSTHLNTVSPPPSPRNSASIRAARLWLLRHELHSFTCIGLDHEPLFSRSCPIEQERARRSRRGRCRAPSPPLPHLSHIHPIPLSLPSRFPFPPCQ